MNLICDLVQQILDSGYLSVEDENKLRNLLKSGYSSEDLSAFMSLQKAAMAGQVKQQSRELIPS